MDKKNISRIEEYLREISKICEINEAYVFGSSVDSQDIDNCDIDLAIISGIFNEDNFIDYLSRFLLVSADKHLNIEPHLFNPDDLEEDFFQREVLSKGIRMAMPQQRKIEGQARI